MVAEGQVDASGSCAKLQGAEADGEDDASALPSAFQLECGCLQPADHTHVAGQYARIRNQPELHESCIMATRCWSIACDVSRLMSGAQVLHFQHFSPFHLPLTRPLPRSGGYYLTSRRLPSLRLQPMSLQTRIIIRILTRSLWLMMQLFLRNGTRRHECGLARPQA